METTEILYTCRICGAEKPIEEMQRDKRKKHGIMNRCKKCRCEQRRENGEYTRERIRKYGYRSGDSKVLLTVKELEGMLQKRTCTYCGLQMDGKNGESAEATLDHLYGLSGYGATSLAISLVPACRACNSSKANSHIYDFYQRSDKFTDQLFRQFVSDFTARLVKREITESEIDVMIGYFEAEARDLRGK
ncbi:HNH endonuclease [Cytobacillus firmus]|uniref:HNH endonuclease n=1 Tax=Cytobacillus firmus TaxID=1399 RepID=UPI0036997338